MRFRNFDDSVDAPMKRDEISKKALSFSNSAKTMYQCNYNVNINYEVFINQRIYIQYDLCN